MSITQEVVNESYERGYDSGFAKGFDQGYELAKAQFTDPNPFGVGKPVRVRDTILSWFAGRVGTVVAVTKDGAMDLRFYGSTETLMFLPHEVEPAR